MHFENDNLLLHMEVVLLLFISTRRCREIAKPIKVIVFWAWTRIKAKIRCECCRFRYYGLCAGRQAGG